MQRVTQLDLARGICVLSIIFIHTTFWSGDYYLPNSIKSISLLLDVPAFFFISGMTACLVKKDSLAKNLTFFMATYFLINLVYGIFFEFSISPKNLLASFFLVTPQTPILPVVAGSLWFCTIFLITVFFSQALIKISYKLLLPTLCIFFTYFCLLYFRIIEPLALSLFTVHIDYLFFYSFFYIAGYFVWYYAEHEAIIKSILKICIVIAIIFFGGLAIYGGEAVYTLQDNKFSPKLPYLLASIPSCVFIYYISRSSLKNKYIEYIGTYAFHFYIMQGISSSILLYIQPYINSSIYVKLLYMFAINLVLAICLTLLAIYIHKKVTSKLKKYNLI